MVKLFLQFSSRSARYTVISITKSPTVNSTHRHPTIKELAQIRAGYQSRKEVKSTPNGSHALLQIRDFDEGRTQIDLENIARIEPGAINEDQVLRDGDVILLSKGAKNFSFAPSGLPKPALAASYFFILRPSRRICPDYLTWYLNLDTTKNVLRKYATQGAHMPVVRRDVLENLEIPVPNLATQRKIVELAALINRQGQLMAELTDKKKIFANAACLRAAKESTNQ
jgi:hypothetical protein